MSRGRASWCGQQLAGSLLHFMLAAWTKRPWGQSMAHSFWPHLRARRELTSLYDGLNTLMHVVMDMFACHGWLHSMYVSRLVHDTLIPVLGSLIGEVLLKLLRVSTFVEIALLGRRNLAVDLFWQLLVINDCLHRRVIDVLVKFLVDNGLVDVLFSRIHSLVRDRRDHFLDDIGVLLSGGWTF